MFSAHVLEHAVATAFDQCQKALNTIGVGLIANILHDRVICGVVRKPDLRVGALCVGVDRCARQSMLIDEAMQCAFAGIRNIFGDDRSIALLHAYHDGLAGGSATLV